MALGAANTNKGYEQFSGAGALESSVANCIKMRRDPDTGVCTVTCVNARNASEFDAFGVKFNDDGALELAEAVMTTKLTNDQLILRSIEGGALSVQQLAAVTGLTERQVRAAVKKQEANGTIVVVGNEAGPAGGGTGAVLYGLTDKTDWIEVTDVTSP